MRSKRLSRPLIMIETYNTAPATPLEECKYCDTQVHWMNTERGARLCIEAKSVLHSETEVDLGSQVVVLPDGETVRYLRNARDLNMVEWVFIVHKQNCPHFADVKVERNARYGTPEFFAFKRMRIAYVGVSAHCERCGSLKGPFHMHELRYLPWEQMTVEDVEILCEECHSKEHSPSVQM